MQTFFSDAHAAGVSTKRYGSDLSSALRSGTLNNGMGLGIRSSFNKLPGAPLRSFELAPAVHTEGSNKFAPPIPASEDVNPRVTVQGRRIMPLAASRLGNADLGPPVERQLAQVWRTRPSEPNIRVDLGGPDQPKKHRPNLFNSLYGAPQLSTEFPGNRTLSVQATPSLATEPTSQNYVLADLQREWAGVDGGSYYLQATANPEMLYHGTRDLEKYYPSDLIQNLRDNLPGFTQFEGFEFDGIPRNTIAEDGTAPQYDDGVIRGNARSQRAAKTYTVAMTSRGDELCMDYWKKQNKEAGTLLYAILKKSPIHEYLHPDSVPGHKTTDKHLLYYLGSKAHDEYRDGASMRRVLEMPLIKVGERKVPMRPLQWHFVTSPTTLDRYQHAEYEDELGITRYGKVVYLGSVLHPPPSGKITTPDGVNIVRPYMDNRHAMRSEPLNIILNPDGGFRSAD